MEQFNSRVITASLLTIVCLFSSCSEKVEKANQELELAKPQQLNFTKPVPGAKLTEEQVQEIKAVFSQQPAIEVAPSSLLLTDPNEKLEQGAAWDHYYSEQAFKATASPESWELYQTMRNTCHKQQGTFHFDATVPLEKVAQPSDLKTGDHVTTAGWGDYGGHNGCDVEASAKFGYSVKVDSLETDGVASGEASYSLKALMKNSKYASLLKSKGIIASSSVTSVVAKQDVNSKDLANSSANLKFNINGSYFTMSNEIPVMSKYSVYAKALTETTAIVQTEILMTIKMPTFSANVVAHIKGTTVKDAPEQKMDETYYVNGHEMTKEEIAKLLGATLNNEKAAAVTSVFMN